MKSWKLVFISHIFERFLISPAANNSQTDQLYDLEKSQLFLIKFIVRVLQDFVRVLLLVFSLRSTICHEKLTFVKDGKLDLMTPTRSCITLHFSLMKHLSQQIGDLIRIHNWYHWTFFPHDIVRYHRHQPDMLTFHYDRHTEDKHAVYWLNTRGELEFGKSVTSAAANCYIDSFNWMSLIPMWAPWGEEKVVSFVQTTFSFHFARF